MLMWDWGEAKTFDIDPKNMPFQYAFKFVWGEH